jgi:hypothetical protein
LPIFDFRLPIFKKGRSELADFMDTDPTSLFAKFGPEPLGSPVYVVKTKIGSVKQSVNVVDFWLWKSVAPPLSL